MEPDIAFSIASSLAMIGWLPLIFLPRKTTLVSAVSGLIIPILLATAYVIIIVNFWGEGSGGFSSLAAVGALFGHPWLLLAGWIHYLVFDLIVGRWELNDAQTHGVHHLLVVPCLIATFLFGPAGWLAYVGLRRIVTPRHSRGAACSGSSLP